MLLLRTNNYCQRLLLFCLFPSRLLKPYIWHTPWIAMNSGMLHESEDIKSVLASFSNLYQHSHFTVSSCLSLLVSVLQALGWWQTPLLHSWALSWPAVWAHPHPTIPDPLPLHLLPLIAVDPTPAATPRSGSHTHMKVSFLCLFLSDSSFPCSDVARGLFCCLVCVLWCVNVTAVRM